MNIVLKGYQEDAVARCLKRVTRAAEDWRDDMAQSAVSLFATTSAGKTIIATALIEQLRFGDNDRDPNPNLTVLWLTNSPPLNRQTMMKMRATSTHIKEHHLVEIDDQISGATLAPGNIYFLNTQKLNARSTSFQASESRPVSLEQMIRNTVDLLGPDFLLVIDEAHIGTKAGEGGKEQVAYRVMNGVDGSGQFPTVLGISATPKRFRDATTAAGRGLQTVEVPVNEIRESGLIKDRILAHVPDDDQYTESKFIRAAVEKWQEATEDWREYHQSDPATADVVPLLLVQVPPGVSDDRLSGLLREIEEHDARLSGAAIAHAFGDPKGPLHLGDRKVNFIAPEDIQGATHVRVVLFKDALTTGWDCPRAEVLVSLRTAKEQTYITQMVGRMVRTPLARRIEGHPSLNDVTMYLPLYNLDALETVRKALSSGEETAVASEFVTKPVSVHLVAGRTDNVLEGDEVVERLRSIVSHRRPGRREPAIVRLGRLAALMERVSTSDNGVPKNAENLANSALADAMFGEYEEHQDEIDARVAEYHQVGVTVVDIGDGAGGASTVERGAEQEKYVATGLPSFYEADRLFKVAARVSGSPRASAALWSRLAGEDITQPDWEDPDKHVESQILAIEIAQLPGMKQVLEACADTKFDSWVSKHGLALKGAAAIEFANIMSTTKAGGETTVSFPERYDTGGAFFAPDGHIYVDDNGQYPVSLKLNPWEVSTIEALKTKFPGLLGWWRNGTGGDQSLGVRYTDSASTARTMYPDFLGIYRHEGEIVLRLFDPHADFFDKQSLTKWAGLAEYLRSDSNTAINEAYAVIRDTHGTLRAVDLGDDEVVEMLVDPTLGDIEKDLFGSAKGFVLGAG